MGTSWSWLSDAVQAGCAVAPGSDKSALAEQLMSCFELGDGLAGVGCSLPTGPTENGAEPGMLQPSMVAEPRAPAFLLHLIDLSSQESRTQIHRCSQPSSPQHRGLIHRSLCWLGLQ